MTNDDLKNLFKNFNVQNGHVVMDRYERSKGFGFVEFLNEKDQRAALEAVNKTIAGGRELTVKIALNFESRNDRNPSASSSSPSSSSSAPPPSSSPAASKNENDSTSEPSTS